MTYVSPSAPDETRKQFKRRYMIMFPPTAWPPSTSHTQACSSCGHLSSLQQCRTECRDGPTIWTFDRENFRHNTPHGPQIHPTGLDPSSSLSGLARAQTGGGLLDRDAPRSSSLTDPPMPLFWITWTFCVGADGSYITKPAGP